MADTFENELPDPSSAVKRVRALADVIDDLAATVGPGPQVETASTIRDSVLAAADSLNLADRPGAGPDDYLRLPGVASSLVPKLRRCIRDAARIAVAEGEPFTDSAVMIRQWGMAAVSEVVLLAENRTPRDLADRAAHILLLLGVHLADLCDQCEEMPSLIAETAAMFDCLMDDAEAVPIVAKSGIGLEDTIDIALGHLREVEGVLDRLRDDPRCPKITIVGIGIIRSTLPGARAMLIEAT